jgi:hypothetical protein
MKISQSQKWLTLSEIAEHLKVASIMICRWFEQNRIAAHHIAGRFQTAEVDIWVLSGEANDPDQNTSLGKMLASREQQE